MLQVGTTSGASDKAGITRSSVNSHNLVEVALCVVILISARPHVPKPLISVWIFELRCRWPPELSLSHLKCMLIGYLFIYFRPDVA